MWQDDDGEEDPSAGPVPDQSERHWRHPSEVGRQAAAGQPLPPSLDPALAGTPYAAGPTAGSSPSLLWPMTIVGGCIAMAALGVLGLYVTGPGTERGLLATASTLDEADLVAEAGIDLARTGVSTPTTTQTEAPVVADTLGSKSEDAGTAASDDQDPAGATPTSPIDNDDKLGSQGDRQPTTTVGDGSALATTTLFASTTSIAADSLAPAPEAQARKLTMPPDGLPGPGLFAGTDDSERLASVLVTGRHLLTSAGAVADVDPLYLLADGRWHLVRTVAADPASDVAVIGLVDAEDELDLDPLDIHPDHDHAATGLPVFVGYCPKPWPTIDPADRDRAAANPLPGCTRYGAGSSLVDRTPEPPPAANAPTDPESATRLGEIYAMDVPTRTTLHHNVFDPLGTSIVRRPEVAGAPLRTMSGEAIGLVMATNDLHLSALPIGRAVEVADSLIDLGYASPSWLGVDGVTSADGVEITSVEDGSPAALAEIEVGDTIIAVQRQQTDDPDFVRHVVRSLEPGATITLHLIAGGRPDRLEITIGFRNG